MTMLIDPAAAPTAQGGHEPPDEKTDGESGGPPQQKDAPGEPHPSDPDMPEAPPGDLIGPGPENPDSPAAD